MSNESRRFFVFFLLTVGLSLKAQDFTFSWNLGTSLNWGRAEEIVYKQSNQPEKLSLLIWNLPVIQTIRMNLRADLPLGFILRVESVLGFPYGSTTMTDWDWITSSDKEDPDIFSDSTSFLVGWFRSSTDIGWGRDFNPQLKTDVFLSYLYLLSSWEGWNSVQGQKNIPGTTTYYGHTIDFRQVWHGLALGGELMYRVNTDLRASALFRFFPWVLYYSRDIHILTGKTYYDTATFGQGLELGLKLGWEISQGVLVRMGYEALWLWSGWGDSLMSNNGSTSSSTAFSLAQGVIGGTYHSMGLFLDFGFVLK